MGRRAKPTHLKMVENSRDRRSPELKAGECVPKGLLDEPPGWLSEDQRDDWAFAIQNAPFGLLKIIDRELLVAWVVAVGVHRQAATNLSNSPMIIRTPNGNVTTSPYLRVINQQAGIMKKLAAEFGFSPAARTGIAVEQPRADDPTDHYFDD